MRTFLTVFRSLRTCVLLACVSLTATLAAGPLTLLETAKTIEIFDGDQVMLVYHKAPMPPPEGKDPAFARSGFIHPLKAPSGGTVTSIHADDHIHHVGLWHAWVKTEHKGRHFDFWNLGGKTGKVRFVRTISTFSEKDKVGFSVQQEQVGMTDDGAKEEVILDETLTVKVQNAEGSYLVDYDTHQTNISDASLILPAYRYGGCIAYRAPYHWNKENSNYLTSEGKDRSNGHTTRGRWCAMFGPTEQGDATLAILCHPKNHDAPQRMRVWPDGKVFFNYVPIQETGWELKPNQPSVMRYRVVISNGKADSERLNAFWNAYSKE
ncbi:PmoA family protein [bacterium]|nr:PmoA family protein [bacterium]